MDAVTWKVGEVVRVLDHEGHTVKRLVSDDGKVAACSCGVYVVKYELRLPPVIDRIELKGVEA